MLSFKEFAGINNVLPSHRLSQQDLIAATDVDIGVGNEIRRRKGHTVISPLCHKNLWQAEGFLLATSMGGLVRSDGLSQVMLHPSLGSDRVWYATLPNGRTAFSNGLLMGVTDGTADGTVDITLPTPQTTGTAVDIDGALTPGQYRSAVVLVRQSDGLESAPEYSPPMVTARGGLLFMGLPREPGFHTDIYLTAKDGEAFYMAGRAQDGVLSITDGGALLVPLRNDRLRPMPKGRLLTVWKGRLLTAAGNVLWASMPYKISLCDMSRDFKQFGAPITLVVPVDDGIYVGTEEELVFLAGDTFDKLSMTRVVPGHVVLGSGIGVRGEHLTLREKAGQGGAMVCIADGVLVSGFNGGNISRLTEGRYRTSVTEVWAAFRMNDGIPQYIAVPR